MGEKIAALLIPFREVKFGRVTFHHVRIKQDLPWIEALEKSGPDTPDYFDIRKPEIAKQYKPEKGEVIKSITLLNSFFNCGWSEILVVAGSYKLERTLPREVFALAAQYPDLYTQLSGAGLLVLKDDPIRVVATTECDFQGLTCACEVWWNGKERGADMQWIGDYKRPSHWLAFTSSK